MTPYKTQNLVYEWVDFSKFSQIWAHANWLKFKKILEKAGDFDQNSAQKLGRLVYEWVIFLEKLQ